MNTAQWENDVLQAPMSDAAHPRFNIVHHDIAVQLAFGHAALILVMSLCSHEVDRNFLSTLHQAFCHANV